MVGVEDDIVDMACDVGPDHVDVASFDKYLVENWYSLDTVVPGIVAFAFCRVVVAFHHVEVAYRHVEVSVVGMAFDAWEGTGFAQIHDGALSPKKYRSSGP